MPDQGPDDDRPDDDRPYDVAATVAVLDEVLAERAAQQAARGSVSHPDGTGRAYTPAATAAREACQAAFQAGRGTWRHILAEEVAEAFAEDDDVALRAELIQVAAVSVAWAEAIDARSRSGQG